MKYKASNFFAGSLVALLSFASAASAETDAQLWSWGSNTYGQLGLGLTGIQPVPGREITEAADWAYVTGGTGFAVALKDDGTLWAWGHNARNELGLGTDIDRSEPAQIGSEDHWVAVASGSYHTLAVTDEGELYAWGGFNFQGQLGLGDTMSRSEPTLVDDGDGNPWRKVAAGGSHSMAIREDGTLWAWGSNASGQLGDGTGEHRESPVEIPVPGGGVGVQWSSAAAGSSHSMAILSDGTLWSWGWNTRGQLGAGDSDNRLSPVQVLVEGEDDDGWDEVAAGRFHTMALRSGELWAWGGNRSGQIGAGGTELTFSDVPLQIGEWDDWTSVVAGDGNSGGIREGGHLWVWGDNSFGQIGDGTLERRTVPERVEPEGGWTAVHLEGTTPIVNVQTQLGLYALGLREEETEGPPGRSLWGWGFGQNGQLANGTFGNVRAPERVEEVSPGFLPEPEGWRHVAAGRDSSLGIADDGTLWAWGANGSGQLGDNSTDLRAAPVRWSDDSWKTVAKAVSHAHAIRDDGTLWGWGFGFLGLPGGFISRLQPTQIGTEDDWSGVAGAGNHSLAIKDDGTLWSWGQNNFGQVGDGTTTVRSTPVQVFADGAADGGWVAVAVGSSMISIRGHSVALREDGSLWAWGSNENGQLGDGTTSDRHEPIKISEEGEYWVFVSAGHEHTLAIRSDGTLWAWGENFFGQLGVSGGWARTEPVQVGEDNDWRFVATHAYHTLGVKKDGSLWSWGRGGDGQLGEGGSTTQWTPQPVDDGGWWTSAAVGDHHSVGVRSEAKPLHYDVAVFADPPDAGTVSGAGEYPAGSLAGVLAQEAEGYAFSAWVENGVVVSTNRFHLVSVNGDRTLEAEFEADEPDIHLINAEAEPTEGGTVGGSGAFAAGAEATLTADANEGYVFSAWTEDGADVSTDAEYTFVVAGDRDLVAVFTAETPGEDEFQVSVYSVPGDGGEVVGGGSYEAGDPVTVTAYAAVGYRFVRWTEDGGEVSAVGEYSFEATGTRTLLAHFESVPAPSGAGTAMSWGGNDRGQLGLGIPPYYTTPQTPAQPTGDWVKVSAGAGLSLAIREDGTLWSWGSNSSGQLGAGIGLSLTFTSRDVPEQVGDDDDWADISAGSLRHSLAVKEDGTLWGWGRNFYGQLGDGTTTSSNVPVRIGTDQDWETVSAGRDHSLGIRVETTDGNTEVRTLWAWGRNNWGQLGDGGESDRYEPVRIEVEGREWAAVSAGDGHSAALAEDGTLWTWGSGSNGRLGHGEIAHLDRPEQVKVDGIPDDEWTLVSAGFHHTLALRSDGTLWAWGSNTHGVLGDGALSSSSVPVQIGDFEDWVYVNTQYRHSAGIREGEDRSLWLWGANTFGQLGDGSIASRESPVEVDGGGDWTAVAVGGGPTTEGNHTLGVEASSAAASSLRAWGTTFRGQAGTGVNGTITERTEIDAGNWSMLGAGSDAAHGVRDDGTLWGWGSNERGQVGDGTTATRLLPVEITLNPGDNPEADTRWTYVASGRQYAAAITDEGTLWSWGLNSSGQLGHGTTVDAASPTQVEGPDGGWRSVSVHTSFTLALAENGTLWAWGSNASGQIGEGSAGGTRATPQQILLAGDEGPDNQWAVVSAGANHGLAVRSDGTLWAWGNNGNGRLGDGTTTRRDAPARIGGHSDWIYVHAADFHSFGIRHGGKLYAWGRNVSSVLGTGTSGDHLEPTRVGDALGWRSVAGFSRHTMAVRDDGSLWAWGSAGDGQIGDGLLFLRSTPSLVDDSAFWVSVAAGGNFSLAIKSDAPSGFTVTTAAHPSGGGTVTGSGDYAAGADVTLSAEAASGFVFVKWTEGGLQIGSEPVLEFTAERHRTLVAHFEADIEDDPETFDGWAEEAFPAGTDPADMLPDADPGGHGIPNLLRFAFVMDPQNPAQSDLPASDTMVPDGEEEEYLTLSFTRRTNAAVDYRVKGRSNMEEDWEQIDDTHIVQVIPVDDSTERVVVRDREPVSKNDSRYMRIVVELLDD